MGEVYRPTDITLGRAVALKVLPDAVAADADRLARFERAARTLAALNHPHIAQIYGFEVAPGGTRALVMELVEGPMLADRLAQGPVPVDEALALARQIAAALEAAHEQGIVHHDLKPANIKVRPDGTVNVLDFRLAKLPDSNGLAADSADRRSLSPTMTTPLLTQAGVLLRELVAGREVHGAAAPGCAERHRRGRVAGTDGRWNPQGGELFYLSPDRTLMSVSLKVSGDRLEAGTPVPLFRTRIAGPLDTGHRFPYAVFPDGQRFLMYVENEGATPAVTVVLDWPSLLRD